MLVYVEYISKNVTLYYIDYHNVLINAQVQNTYGGISRE